MKAYNSTIANLIDQIGQVNNLILLHSQQSDGLMVEQYQARRLEYMKDLLTALVSLSATTPRIHEVVKSIVEKIEANTPHVNEMEISTRFKFSLTQLEALIAS